MYFLLAVYLSYLLTERLTAELRAARQDAELELQAALRGQGASA